MLTFGILQDYLTFLLREICISSTVFISFGARMLVLFSGLLTAKLIWVCYDHHSCCDTLEISSYIFIIYTNEFYFLLINDYRVFLGFCFHW